MTHAFYRVADGLPGALTIMSHPPADGLPDAMRFYREAGVSVIVSMLPEDEARALGLGDEAALAAEEEVRFLSHPIPDFGLPDLDGFRQLIAQVVGLIRAGDHVAVHCRAGIGRSGMVVASALCALGDPADVAIKRVSVARGVPIPDTVEQGNFVAEFAALIDPK